MHEPATTTAEIFSPLPEGEHRIGDLLLTLGPASPLDEEGCAREGRTPEGTVHLVLEYPLGRGSPSFELAFNLSGVAVPVSRTQREGRSHVVLRPRKGPTLEDVLRRRDGLPAWGLPLVEALAGLIQRVHDGGLCFRALLPHMFSVGPEGQVELETPHVLCLPGERLSGARSLFTAPDALETQRADRSADQFALGMLSYCLLATRFPFWRGGLPHLRIFQPEIPHGAVSVVARAVSFPADRRFESCAAFARELRTRTAPRGRGAQRLAVAAATEIGRQKKLSMPVNQDAYFVGFDDSTRRGLFLVADGVSTADVGSGDLASAFVRDAVKASWEGPVGEILRTHRGEVPEEWLRTALDAILEDASARIYAFLKQPVFVGALNPGVHPASSTSVLGILDGDRLVIGSVGDSRAYLLRDGALEQMTVDQDLRTDVLRSGRDPAAVNNAGTLGALTQSIGGFLFQSDGGIALRPIKPEPLMIHLRAGDRVLICSDGVPDNMGDAADEIMLRELSRGGDPAAIARSLCSIADEMMGGDNITALVLLA
jgi:protein phosphatase